MPVQSGNPFFHFLQFRQRGVPFVSGLFQFGFDTFTARAEGVTEVEFFEREDHQGHEQKKIEELPRLESRIEFTIAMPSAVMGTEKDVTIHCIGRVVRHYLQGGQKKAAAVIDEYFLKA